MACQYPDFLRCVRRDRKEFNLQTKIAPLDTLNSIVPNNHQPAGYLDLSSPFAGTTYFYRYCFIKNARLALRSSRASQLPCGEPNSKGSNSMSNGLPLRIRRTFGS